MDGVNPEEFLNKLLESLLPHSCKQASPGPSKITDVSRVFLALWLAAFTIQATDVLIAAAPDACTQETRDTSSDQCPDACLRCLCCARVAAFVPHLPQPAQRPLVIRAIHAAPLAPSTTPSPHGILHVPRAS